MPADLEESEHYQDELINRVIEELNLPARLWPLQRQCHAAPTSTISHSVIKQRRAWDNGALQSSAESQAGTRPRGRRAGRSRDGGAGDARRPSDEVDVERADNGNVRDEGHGY